MQRTQVLVFLKYPRAGQVKTRLARDIGSEKALAVYRRLLEITFSVTDQLPAETFAVFAVCDPRHTLKEYQTLLASHRCSFSFQKGDDLGDRLKHAFGDSFQTTNRTIVIGTDCADLKASHLLSAADALDRCDLVLGPSFDGGYYLLGCNRFYPELFEEIPWSTERVFDLTREKALAAKLKVHTLERLVDIDTVEELPKDWIEFRN